MSINDFTQRYQQLNDAQRSAVDTIEGPVLVIAGPGTGKTELLTLRVANILLKSDTRPENILCLTFTESAAFEMRQRLVNIVGQQAYNISISTYHAFGRELIARYPDYFNDNIELRPIDELGQHTIITSIIETLPYDNPFKKSGDNVRDILSTISECKRALISPDELERIAAANLTFITNTNPIVAETLAGIARISKSSIPAFEKLATITTGMSSPNTEIVSIGTLWANELHAALDSVHESGKTSALTAWKNAWLERDAYANYVIAGQATNKKMVALADIYRQYLLTLETESVFDYDDMILRAIRGLQEHDDLKFTLQERYLYVLLDEFQDTNGAQFELVKLLCDSPLYEGRPNVLAVGDDDQAIYAFQGADYSHMLAFQQQFRDVKIINLTENYRSHDAVLHVAHNIATQIEERLHHHLQDIEKTITAKSTSLPKDATVERHEFKSDIAQYGWITEKISHLIESGTDPSEIAILAPKHRYLEPIIPYLRQGKVPIRYEKRENVLEDTHIVQLLQMAELVNALQSHDFSKADALWPEILSYDFWQVSTEDIWKLSWQAYESKQDWTTQLIQESWGKEIGLFFVKMSNLAAAETLETMLDYLIGTTSIRIDSADNAYQSPYYEYYFSKQRHENDAADFWSLLSNLTVLRQHLREYQPAGNSQLKLSDFVHFANNHIAARIKILNTSPYHESTNAGQIMTAYKSKGLEFQHVFIVAAIDEVWGSRAKTQSTRVPLPVNLQFIRYQGASDDERLRLLFVAITRAKYGLYMTSYENNYANRLTSRLKFLEETEDRDGSVTSPLLPGSTQTVYKNDNDSPAVSDLVAYWQQRHSESARNTPLQQLLQPRIDQYQMAPTHLNSFIDTVYSGPEHFFINTILRFPKAPSVDGEFGNAIHEVLEWIHREQRRIHKLPTLDTILQTFDSKLNTRRISNNDRGLLAERGKHALTAYLEQRGSTFQESDEHEFNFRNQGVFIGKAHLTGKIDKMIIDKKARAITVVDYKTGKSYKKWTDDIKLHKYKQQLYMYKLLIEGSYEFADYTVTGARLEFVEPNTDGDIVDLELVFDKDEIQRLTRLISAVWAHITTLNFPDISSYSKDTNGTIAFETALIQDSDTQ